MPMATDRDIEIIALPECVDSTTAGMIEQANLPRIQPGRRIVIDGALVTYMGAAGVRALAVLLHRAQEVGARVVFCRF